MTVPSLSELFDGPDVVEQIDEAIRNHSMTAARLKGIGDWAEAFRIEAKINALLDQRLSVKGAA